MGVGLNTGFPIAFIFSHSENKDSYKMLLNKVTEITNIQFYNVVMESDQGTALKSIVQDFQMLHLLCLRHFLHNIKVYEYAYQAKLIINCTSEFEYNETCKKVANVFHNSINKMTTQEEE